MRWTIARIIVVLMLLTWGSVPISADGGGTVPLCYPKPCGGN